MMMKSQLGLAQTVFQTFMIEEKVVSQFSSQGRADLKYMVVCFQLIPNSCFHSTMFDFSLRLAQTYIRGWGNMSLITISSGNQGNR